MSDEVLSPDEQIIRDMGDEMNEIRVGRAKAYFQIRQLRTQLAEANTRIETLTRRLEAAQERAEAWEEAALGKTGKQSFDEMERSWRETVARAEEVEAERDELKRQLAADSKEHFETWKRLKQAEVELRRWRGCPSCKEDHDDSVMCPPHEVRTSGRAWFHIQARRWAERAEELQVERDELQRKLDACQCETRVLNESMLIEAKQEQDQLVAEAARLREVLELVKPARQDIYGWQRTDGHIDNCGCAWCVVNRALAATPLAAKAAERVRVMRELLPKIRQLLSLPMEPTTEAVDLRAEVRTALDRLAALDKPDVKDKGVMKRITVVCDRCGSSVDGLEEEGVGTGGFYRRPGWGQYMNEGENTICDACMQSDARYRAAQ